MNKNLVVGLPTSSFLPAVGGAEIGLHNIAIELINNNCSPVIIIPFRSYLYLKKKKYHLPYTIIPFPPKIRELTIFSPKTSFCFFNLYMSVIDWFFKIDIYHVTSAFPAGVLITQFVKKNHKPVIIRAIGSDIQIDESIGYGQRLNKKVDLLIKKHIHNANLLIATTQTVFKEYKKLNIPEKKLVEIPNGVNLNHFNIIVKKHKIRKRLGISNNAFIFLSVGRYHPKKGYEYLLEAVKSLKEKVKNEFIVLIVGKDLDQLDNRVNELNIKDNIKFIDSILNIKEKDNELALPSTELVEIYKIADTFVMPSLLETFGIVLVEAMASRLPIISTSAPGCIDVIENGKYGYMVPAGDSETLSDAMLSFINNKELIKSYSKLSLFASKKYDWNNIVKQYLGIYKQILGY